MPNTDEEQNRYKGRALIRKAFKYVYLWRLEFLEPRQRSFSFCNRSSSFCICSLSPTVRSPATPSGVMFQWHPVSSQKLAHKRTSLVSRCINSHATCSLCSVQTFHSFIPFEKSHCVKDSVPWRCSRISKITG